MRNKKFVGYQIESADRMHSIPDGFFSFQILSMATVDNFFTENKTNGEWVVIPIYDGDIEEPKYV